MQFKKTDKSMSAKAKVMEIKKTLSFTKGLSAFSIVEVMVAMSIVGVVFVSLYAGLSSGFAMIKVARENLRAIQLIQEKVEVIRLCTFTQVTNGYIPASFQDAFDPTQTNGGIVYAGTMVVTNAGFSEAYSNTVRKVTVTLNWTSGGVPRQRSVSTYVSSYGMQHYIY